MTLQLKFLLAAILTERCYDRLALNSTKDCGNSCVSVRVQLLASGPTNRRNIYGGTLILPHSACQTSTMITDEAQIPSGPQVKDSGSFEEASTNIEELKTTPAESLSLESLSPESESSPHGSNKQVVLDHSAHSPVQLSIHEETRLYRKIDMRLLPMLVAIQVVSFLDRGSYPVFIYMLRS